MYAGIDAGSRAIKVVLIGDDGLGIVAKGQVDQGVEQDKLACRLFEKVLADGRHRPVGRSPDRRHRLRPQRDRDRRYDDHRDHVPRRGRAASRAGRHDRHRYRRPGQ